MIGRGLRPVAAACLAVVAGLVLGLAVLTGCATVSGGDGAFTAILTKDAPFSSGPGQDVPDKYLEAGTRVRAMGTGGGSDFVRVQTVSGEVGFVPRSALGEAPDTNQ